MKFCAQYIYNDLNTGRTCSDDFYIIAGSWHEAMKQAKNLWYDTTGLETYHDYTMVIDDAVALTVFNCDDFNNIDRKTNYITFS